MGNSKSKAQYVLAMILIIVGGSSLLNQMFGWQLFRHINLDGLFVLIPGLWFEYMYFSKRRSPGLLVPGGILTTIGLLVLIEDNTFRWVGNYIDSLYILAPAIGLFQLYLYDKRDRGLLIPVGILTFIAIIDLLSNIMGDVFFFMDSSLIWPIILVILGVALLIGKQDQSKEKERL